MASQRGVTLVEMLIVVGLLGLLVGITFPSVTAGIDSLRLNSATDSIVSFLNAGLNRAERFQETVEVEISLEDNTLALRSSRPGFLRTLELPEGVVIRAVHPDMPGEQALNRRFLIFPGGTPPRIGVELVNGRGVRRIVRVDPITGVPQIERLEAP